MYFRSKQGVNEVKQFYWDYRHLQAICIMEGEPESKVQYGEKLQMVIRSLGVVNNLWKAVLALPVNSSPPLIFPFIRLTLNSYICQLLREAVWGKKLAQGSQVW